MKTMQKGFTLIELMIVVAIIAILAAIAIPQYQNYITKAQFSESQTVADGLKTPIVEYYNQTGVCPVNTNGSAAASSGGMALPGSYAGKYVATATTAAGAAASSCEIEIAFKTTTGSVSTPLLSKYVNIVGTNNGGSFSWVCAPGTTGTNIATQYLPQACVGN
jgi:type IV pilus assembly protein PilA